mgnify:CR=1 FL=1
MFPGIRPGAVCFKTLYFLFVDFTAMLIFTPISTIVDIHNEWSIMCRSGVHPLLVLFIQIHFTLF